MMKGHSKCWDLRSEMMGTNISLIDTRASRGLGWQYASDRNGCLGAQSLIWEWGVSGILFAVHVSCSEGVCFERMYCKGS